MANIINNIKLDVYPANMNEAIAEFERRFYLLVNSNEIKSFIRNLLIAFYIQTTHSQKQILFTHKKLFKKETHIIHKSAVLVGCGYSYLAYFT